MHNLGCNIFGTIKWSRNHTHTLAIYRVSRYFFTIPHYRYEMF